MRFIILVSVLAIFPLIMSASYLSLIETNDNQTLIRYNIDKQLVSFDGAFPEMCTNDNQDSFILNNYHLPVLHTFLQIPNGHKAILSIKNPSYEEVYHQKLSKIDDDVIYLNSHVLVSDPFIMRNNLLTTLSIQPYVYYPDETKVVMLKEADIMIRYIPDSVNNIEREIKQSKEFKDWLSKATINYRDYTRLGNADGSILIVYNQTASPLSLIQPLIDWKHQKGWVVNAVSTTVTGTTTAGIKNYIQNAYNTWANPPEYILLIGRAIQSNNVPTYTEYYNYSTVGDYKYTLLEGSDIIPDAYIGRLTFASTDQLSSMINKIIAYEKRQGLASNNWFNSSLLVSDETDSGHSCTITLQYVRDLMLEYNPSSQNTFVNSGTIPSQIYSALNQGVSNFYYRGFNGYSGMTNTDIGNLLNTGKYPFISLITCFSGNFGQTSQLSIGEQFMRIGTTSAPKGAIGFIGSSCETHTCLNNIMTGSIAYGFYKEKLTNQGQALLRAKLGLYACYPQNPANYIQQNFQSLNLLGDPSLDIWLKQPLDLVIHNSTTANAVNGYLQVQATDSFGIPVSQAKVCILKGNDEIFQVGYTNSNGYVVLNWNQATNGIATLTVSKAGYAPHQSSVVIDEQVVPFTISNISAFEQLMSGAYYSLPLSLTNHYYSALLNVTAIFSSQSEYVSIVSGTVSFGNMAFNQTLTSLQNVEFRISKQCPHNENLAFSLRVIGYYNDDQISFDLHFQVSEGGPDLAIIDYQIGTDNIIIPGVSTNLYIKIKNFGNVTATGINATIYSFNPNVTLSQINQPYNNLFPQYSTLNSTPYIIETNANLYSGTPLLIWVDVTYNNGASQLMTLTINVGSSTQTAMTGPDDYGYICVASGDNHPLAQPYNWIEIDPAFGGGGTLLALTDNDTEGSGSFATVQIPFTFKYYGVAYNEITICSNGFLMPGTQGSNEWMNWQIPGPMVPRPIIAPFWDDLIIGTTSKILYKYDSVNDKFIVEWSNMRNRYNQQVLETFQVVIYSMTSYHTQTSDNAILFQYKAFNNVDAGNYGVSHIDHGQYSTVGIADHTGMVGLQYTFQNQYPPTAAPITNNSTLLFITILNQNYTPVLVYHSYQFSEAIPVFNNNQINSGETISISPIINNAGPTTLSPSSVILSTASDYATVVSSVSAISEIVALQNAGVNSPFLIQIAEDCPNLTEIVFELTIMNVLYTYHLNFSVIVHSPQVTFSDIML
ncbi:MAG: hypothetical protein FJ041_01650, partial [Candidatus Cloacimonetes bacterium]|nr:hypothetical protein [Candidatus Cloacimonadota bacterium]